MVTARHPERLRRTVTTEALEQTLNFLCHRSHSPWTTPSDQPAARPTVAVWEKAPAPSSYQVIQRNLSSFWKSFNPDLDTPTPNYIYPGDGGLAEVRWRSAPGGTDNWETATEPSNEEDDEIFDEDTRSQDSDTTSISLETTDNTLGIPLKFRLLPGQVHLLNPQVDKINISST